MMFPSAEVLLCLIVLLTGYQSVDSEITRSIILSNPTLCKTCEKQALVDFVPFTIESCPCPATETEADTVSVTLALNKSNKDKCSVCQAREEERLSYGACRPPIQIASTVDARIQEGGLHALNNKVVRLDGSTFTPSYQQTGFFAERAVCPHLRQCTANDIDQQTDCQ
ncbi:uncharacterized protein LOC111047811 [Nilaparvata lugens]|uniref:uncharacterized protein LOC111047811 n=1 Tax=Nilaparvata lugens TaxID=108931 RepID=UPI000B999C16|nr:uncharacterized protein LOC111047811 [Nilaparvata lugens]